MGANSLPAALSGVRVAFGGELFDIFATGLGLLAWLTRRRKSKLLAMAVLALLGSANFADAITITRNFEEGLAYGLGHGPVAVDSEFGVSFSNASYALGPSGTAPYILALGQVVITPYVPNLPMAADFDFAATSVSVAIAASGMASIVNTLSAYGPSGELFDSDSITDIVGAGPYSLSVEGADIRRVVMTGQLWADQFNGFTSEFDNLSITAAPVASVPTPQRSRCSPPA